MFVFSGQPQLEPWRLETQGKKGHHIYMKVISGRFEHLIENPCSDELWCLVVMIYEDDGGGGDDDGGGREDDGGGREDGDEDSDYGGESLVIFILSKVR